MKEKNGDKSPASNAKRQAAFRAKKRESGLKEVRGIFANDESSAKIKEFAAMLKGT